MAQYDEYRPHLIEHLVKRKIMHWDIVIRQLTAQASYILLIENAQLSLTKYFTAGITSVDTS